MWLTWSKTCPHCHETKDTSEFYRATDKPDGLQTYCKACHKAMISPARVKRWHEQHRDYRRAYQRAWERKRRAQRKLMCELQALELERQEALR